MDPRPARRLRDVVLRRLVALEAFARRTLTDPVAGAITLVFGLGIAGLTGLVAATVYDAVTEHEGVAGLDRPVLSWMVGHRTPTLDRAVTWFTDLGSTAIMPWIATAAVVVLAVLWRSWTPPLIMAAGTAGSLLMTTVGKAVVGRVRPPLSDAVAPYESSFSFPSGHTLNTTMVAGVLAYLVIARYRRRGVLVGSVVVAAAFAGAMGLSRVYLGHHWLTDVLVAWALGAAWLALLITGRRIWQLRLPGAEPQGVPPDPAVDGDVHPGMREGSGGAQS